MRDKRLGFTLVELMVVVAVTMILTGIGAASLNKINNNQQLESSKSELVTDLNLARNMAITSQVPQGIDDSLKYVLVNIGIGGSIKAEAVTANNGEQVYFTKNNNSINNDLTFGFSVENGRLTDDQGSLVNNSICLTLYLPSNLENKKYIYIDISGLIYEKDDCN